MNAPTQEIPSIGVVVAAGERLKSATSKFVSAGLSVRNLGAAFESVSATAVAVGAAVGAIVGVVVGATVGFVVGAIVGVGVGAAVGVLVGAEVGVFVGPAVGDELGADEADTVGVFVGALTPTLPLDVAGIGALPLDDPPPPPHATKYITPTMSGIIA